LEEPLASGVFPPERVTTSTAVYNAGGICSDNEIVEGAQIHTRALHRVLERSAALVSA
jgi:hypothetical protein